MAKLTAKARAFCEAYVDTDGDIPQSARIAGYKSKNVYSFPKQPAFAAEIDRIRKERAATGPKSERDRLMQACRDLALDSTLSPTKRLEAIKSLERMETQADPSKQAQEAAEELLAFIDEVLSNVR